MNDQEEQIVKQLKGDLKSVNDCIKLLKQRGWDVYFNHKGEIRLTFKKSTEEVVNI